MKHLLMAVFMLCCSTFAIAQSSFEKAMKKNIQLLNQSVTQEQFNKNAEDFASISKEDPSQWLPYYYTAYSYIQQGKLLLKEGKMGPLNEVAAVANKYLSVAMQKSPNNAENYILLKMVHRLKMLANTGEEFFTEGVKADQAIATAEKLDPNNPRITLLKAEDLYNTPSDFGGSKEKGIQLFKKALKHFEVYTPASDISPNWGRAEAKSYINR